MTIIEARVHGLSHFSNYFSSEKDSYVIIGGIATMFSLEPLGISPRATKDIDLVILSNPNIYFADKIKLYVRDGGYEINIGSSGLAHNYRFRKPRNPDFPFQIEVFSTTTFDFILEPGQNIIPIETSTGQESLSAILMDKDYFDLVRSNVLLDANIPVLGISALIPLKAKAFLDLSERKAKGDTIDSREIKKHRTDVIKLIAALGDNGYTLKESIASDLKRFFSHHDLQNVQKETIREITGVSTSIGSLIEIALQHYGLTL